MADRCKILLRRGTRPGERCRNPAKANGCCRLHGGNLPRGMSKETLAKTYHQRVASFGEPRRRWLARMHELKRLGIIKAIPGYARTPRARAAHEGEYLRRTEAVALSIIEKTLETLPAEVDKPAEEMTMGELLASGTRESLLFLRDLIRQPHIIDGAIDYKLLNTKSNAATTFITNQVRVDESVMRRQAMDRLPDMLRRIAEARGEVVEQPPADGYEDSPQIAKFKQKLAATLTKGQVTDV